MQAPLPSADMHRAAPPPEESAPGRSLYAPDASDRVKGFILTVLLFISVFAALYVSFRWSFPASPASAPLMVNNLPLASPPRQPVPEKPKIQHRQHRQPRPVVEQDVDRTTIRWNDDFPPPPPAVTPPNPDPAPQQFKEIEEAAPKTVDAPEEQHLSANAKDNWEGRVLARIARFKRYSATSRAAHHEGIVTVRFRMNRAGHVLSVSIAHSSAFPDLDQAALDTVTAADPLPRIPKDRPDELDMVVPVEFSLHPAK